MCVDGSTPPIAGLYRLCLPFPYRAGRSVYSRVRGRSVSLDLTPCWSDFCVTRVAPLPSQTSFCPLPSLFAFVHELHFLKHPSLCRLMLVPEVRSPWPTSIYKRGSINRGSPLSNTMYPPVSFVSSRPRRRTHSLSLSLAHPLPSSGLPLQLS